MELENLKELISLLKDTDITELLVEKEGVKVKIRRDRVSGRHAVLKTVPAGAGEVREEEPVTGPEPAGNHFTVKSPIVGTFYRSPSPDAEPFVDAGTVVKKGQVLCIIEAMKLMNEIESEIDGIVTKILVDNGHPVEYGESLFLIEPTE